MKINNKGVAIAAAVLAFGGVFIAMPANRAIGATPGTVSFIDIAPASPGGPSQAVRTEIDNGMRRAQQALSHLDIDGAMAYVSPDWVLTMPNGKKLSLQEVKKTLKINYSLFKSFTLGETLSSFKMDGSAVLADTVAKSEGITNNTVLPAGTSIVTVVTSETRWEKRNGIWKSVGTQVIETKSTTDGEPIPSAYAAVAGETSAQPPAQANGLAAGYSETYRFTQEGKAIGTQSASLNSVAGDVQNWTFNIDLQAPAGGKIVPIYEAANAQITTSGKPRTLTMNAKIASSKQHLVINFSGPHAAVNAMVDGTAVNKTIDTTPDQYLLMANNITLFSLALRTQERPAGKPITLPFFLVDGLQPITATLTEDGAETLAGGGQSVPCRIYNVSPLGWRVWSDALTGGVLKVRVSVLKLDIVRD